MTSQQKEQFLANLLRRIETYALINGLIDERMGLLDPPADRPDWLRPERWGALIRAELDRRGTPLARLAPFLKAELDRACDQQRQAPDQPLLLPDPVARALARMRDAT